MPDPNDPNQQQPTPLPQPPAAPKQGFFSNLGGDIASVLSSPTVKEAIPALIGAAGGALTGERGHPKEQLGRALEGGLSGWEVGQQNQLRQQQAQMMQLYRGTMMKHLAIEDQVASGKIAQSEVDQKRIAAFNALPPEEQAKYGNDPKVWSQVSAHTAIAHADVPSKQQAVAAMLQTPTGAQYLSAYGISKPGDIPTDPAYLNKILANRGNATKQQADLARIQAETARAQAGISEAGAHMAEIGTNIEAKKMEMAGTMPARAEAPDVKERNEATAEYLKATLPSRVEATDDKTTEDNAKTVTAVKTAYDKEHPVMGGDAGRNKAVLQAGYDPLTSKPIPGGAMRPTGKPARTSSGTLLPNGLHKDANGNVAYVLDGMIYTH